MTQSLSHLTSELTDITLVIPPTNYNLEVTPRVVCYFLFIYLSLPTNYNLLVTILNTLDAHTEDIGWTLHIGCTLHTKSCNIVAPRHILDAQNTKMYSICRMSYKTEVKLNLNYNLSEHSLQSDTALI